MTNNELLAEFERIVNNYKNLAELLDQTHTHLHKTIKLHEELVKAQGGLKDEISKNNTTFMC